MFKMKIEKQLNIKDRTLIAGIPEYDVIPSHIEVDGHRFAVIGTSLGIQPPFISLEIERTDIHLEGKTI